MISRAFKVEVINKMEKLGRSLLVYNSVTGDEVIIPRPEPQRQSEWPGEVFVLPPEGKRGEEAYLLVTVTPGPGDLEDSCLVELPFRARAQFMPERRRETLLRNLGERNGMSVAPGAANWHLKITHPNSEYRFKFKAKTISLSSGDPDEPREPDPDNVSVGDDG